ncbi:predicted protein [Histoplasma capsulatum G186AR]|uniref:Uncharacterized protein n=1 Tax=Ajellomyces capsulatus (strain G186AR / H82 / ATCC MYA-2454 / RMSCC 2432) TaxID=447093 RepID=C0NK81_AJECG|nr:uncharacterized protein HCBG_03561 [Histoplasma capsulatum G186AR]EEH08272.1 predicted protein [Histoplasma capsulatum G186AR]
MWFPTMLRLAVAVYQWWVQWATPTVGRATPPHPWAAVSAVEKWGQAALKAVERLARCLARTTHHAEPSSLTDGTLSSSRYTGSSPGGDGTTTASKPTDGSELLPSEAPEDTVHPLGCCRVGLMAVDTLRSLLALCARWSFVLIAVGASS